MSLPAKTGWSLGCYVIAMGLERNGKSVSNRCADPPLPATKAQTIPESAKAKRLLGHSLVIATLIIGVLSPTPYQCRAQIFTSLYSFSRGQANMDGASPGAGLILSGERVYGTSSFGGLWGSGTFFSIKTEGSGFTNLYTFGNEAGAAPGDLTASGSWLYGTSARGGAYGSGLIYRMTFDGSDFEVIYNFSSVTNFYFNLDGASPLGSLMVTSNELFGVATRGGPLGGGTVFRVNLDGGGFTNLHWFSCGPNRVFFLRAGVVLSGDTLYGTTQYDGRDYGTVFALKTDGTGFTNLHSFSPWGKHPYYTNADGCYPIAPLTISGSTLYGTTVGGGKGANGTIFRLNTDGTSFTCLHHFPREVAIEPFPNSDGFGVWGPLLLVDDVLYGAAAHGGKAGNGTVFSLGRDGSNFTVLHHFSPFGGNGVNEDGGNPQAGLILAGSALYGTTMNGGFGDNGTVFRLLLQPRLSLRPSGRNLILSWPTNATDFRLYYTTSLGSTSQWFQVLDVPVVHYRDNLVTNALAETSVFYRLSQ
jgi:uncharacterized repeat protein (TIGR03803 family)